MSPRFKYCDDAAHKSGHYPGWGMDGERLHCLYGGGVPPQKWCVSKADMKFLRREIKAAIRNGKIRPTALDPFDPFDDTCGPNMYNVVEAYIKPMTLEAGKMSWALLRHPDGLNIDFFITHCWAEGAFEFLDKVIASWPKGKKHAWCCILANPQNLDISQLIKEPLNSPFALALQNASLMMVVSTGKCSIYTRVWCVFEAHLAVRWDKEIFTANRPRSYIVTFISILALIVASIFQGQFRDQVQMGHHVESVHTFLAMVFGLMAHFFQLVWYHRQKHLEADQLHSNYTTITEAHASSDSDKQHILEEIGRDVSKVNQSIELLLTTGISTPDFRQARALGVRSIGMGDPSFPYFSWYTWFLCCTGSIATVFTALAVSFNVLLIVVFTVRFHHASIGERALMNAVCNKLALLALLTYVVVFLPIRVITGSFGSVLYTLLPFFGVSTLAFSQMGMAGMARIPHVGPMLAELLGPGWRHMFNKIFAACGLHDTAAKFSSAVGFVMEEDDLPQALASIAGPDSVRVGVEEVHEIPSDVLP